MIVGEITPDREAIIRLTLRDTQDQDLHIDFVLDTGYTEYLTLPPGIIAALGLHYQYSVPMYLADGNRISFRVFDGVVLWNGQARSIPIQETSGDPLLGMSLLMGSRLFAEIVDGGEVVIDDLANPTSSTES